MADSAADQTADLLSVAELFSKCMNCFDFYKGTKDYGSELNTLLVQLDFEKTRLLKWADYVGLIEVSSKKREIDVERLLEPSIWNALESVRTLLTGNDQAQATFGIKQRDGPDIPPPPYALELAPISDIVSRNSMTIFRTNYGRFCAKYDTQLPRGELVPRIRWLVRDRDKFGGLINALKEIVDDLFSFLKLERSVHEEAIELDILNNNNLSELRLVEDAAEASSYPAFARAASIAIDRTEAGTVHRGGLVKSQAFLNTEMPNPVTLNQVPNQLTRVISLSSLKHAKLFFMVTPECMSYVGSCIDEDFQKWDRKDGYESSLSPEAIWRRMLRQLDLHDCLHHDDLDTDLRNARKIDEHGNPQQVETIASITIVVAPCLRLVSTATNICTMASGAKARLLSFHIYVDDRLHCSCSDSKKNEHRLGALVNHWRSSYSSWRVSLPNRLDLTRMEQRVYDFQQELPPLTSGGNLDDLFDESKSRVDVAMPVAAILVIGEDQEIVRLFRELPLTLDPRMPTAGQFYNIRRPSWNSMQWQRYFLGSYRLRTNLKPRVSVLNASDTAALSPLQFRPISPTSQTSNNKKRKLSTQESSAASQNALQEGTVPVRVIESTLSDELPNEEQQDLEPSD